MSVVTTEGDNFRPHPDKCTFCNDWLGTPPYIVWDPFSVKGECIVICRRCGPKIKRGLTADLIHLTAIVEMKAALGYDNSTLVRK